MNVGKISFNVVKKAFATWQPAFYDILARAGAKIKISRPVVFGRKSDPRL